MSIAVEEGLQALLAAGLVYVTNDDEGRQVYRLTKSGIAYAAKRAKN